jgi:hypothetical protein
MNAKDVHFMIKVIDSDAFTDTEKLELIAMTLGILPTNKYQVEGETADEGC